MLRFIRNPSFPALSVISFMVLCGCRTFAPAPIDWPREASEWSASATNRVALTLAEARQLALVLNPEINVLRLKHLSSKNQAQASGWWEDPALDLDALRILSGGDHPWLLGSGLTFSLPLNGVPGLEKRAAQAYAHADALAVTVAERALLAEVDRLWNACRANLRCVDAQNAYKARLSEREKQVRALVAAGELPKAEADRIEQTRVAITVDCACCGPDAVARRHAFKRLLGLPPEAAGEVASDDGEAVPPPPAVAGLVPPASALDLVRHPNVQEKLVRLKAGEEELRAEIRKQYPELKIGPRYEHEDGEAKLGLSFGFTLPLWNRNRKGIADAEGGRDETRLEALNAWRDLVAEWQEASAMREAAAVKERGLREELLPAAQAAAERTERLFRQGEADVLALLAADENVYDLQEKLIDAQTALSEARVRLELLHVPASTEMTKDR